jgi:hypothetical protein
MMLFSFLSLSLSLCCVPFRNPSSGSIQMSDTGSLDRMKAQAERRKKEIPTITGRVENTRVNPDKTIDELFATHKLEQLEEDKERECSFVSTN